jgi:hypothetical protein
VSSKLLEVSYEIEVLGKIWMPTGAFGAMSFKARKEELDEKHPSLWIRHNTGDFESIIDFYIIRVEVSGDFWKKTIHRKVIRPWDKEENETKFNKLIWEYAE